WSSDVCSSDLVDAGVELRENLQSGGANFQSDRGHRHFAAGFLRFGSETRAQLLAFGNVGAVLLRDVRNRVPGFGKMLGGFAANSAHGNALSLAPLGEVGKLRSREVPRSRRRLRRRDNGCQQSFGVGLRSE